MLNMVMNNLLIYWKPVIEIAILWFVIYHMLLFFEGTRAVQVMRGVVIILIAFLLFQRLHLQVLNWLLTKLFGISVIALLIIFHPEIRQGLARIGQGHLFNASLREEELEKIFLSIAEAAENLSKDKMGALIVLERNDSLVPYAESGELIDARVSSDLIQAIFTHNNPLHDGGLIVQHGRILAAGCLFPLTQNTELSRIFGTRHRAALGLSEETDAVIIIVSEERRDMSVVYKGKLYKDLGKEEMVNRVKDIFKLKEENA